MTIETFKEFIKNRLGLHFGTDDDEQLTRLLRQRMAVTRLESVEDYLRLVDSAPVEFRALTSQLTINETYFYREPQHLRLLTERLAPPLLERARGGAPLRILSVGCATGEEPYSIAIALHERFGERDRRCLQISACDVDETALERARAGIYGRFAFRALPDALRHRYFAPVEGTPQRRIDHQIRRQVEFLMLNLLAPEYPERLLSQDLIFFRNVSLYFDTDTRRAVMTRLRDLLNPGGHLIVGTAETLANDFGLMRLHAQDGVFLFTKEASNTGPQVGPATHSRHQHALPGGGHQPDLNQRGTSQLRPAGPDPHVQPPMPVATAPAGPLPAADAVYTEAIALTRAERFEVALQRLAPGCGRVDAPAHWLVLQAHLYLECGDLERAAAAARRAIERDAWCRDAHLLLANCARRRGDNEAAMQALRQVLYDDPRCWQAHYQLAEVQRELGNIELAQREYQIVLRQLEDETLTLRSVAELPSPLSVKDLRFLCETRLTRLPALRA